MTFWEEKQSFSAGNWNPSLHHCYANVLYIEVISPKCKFSRQLALERLKYLVVDFLSMFEAVCLSVNFQNGWPINCVHKII